MEMPTFWMISNRAIVNGVPPHSLSVNRCHCPRRAIMKQSRNEKLKKEDQTDEGLDPCEHGEIMVETRGEVQNQWWTEMSGIPYD